MKQLKIPLPTLEIEPINEIDWHLSEEGQLSNKLHRTVEHLTSIKQGLEDILRIIDPKHTENNVLKFKELRDNCTAPLQTEMYFHNRMKALFDSGFLIPLTKKDEQFYNISKDELTKVLREKEREFQIYDYRRIARRINREANKLKSIF